MLFRKIFENLHAVMAILVLFVQFSRKFCLNFLTLIASLNMMHFVRTFSIMLSYSVRPIAIKEVRNYGKNCIHQKHFRKWLVGGCMPFILTPWIRRWP